ncbi:MAG: hypothetical protein OEV74_16320 [Cyclobacteriaceae bacterium]|nr:hypothetical protein [Cyclobacteriaceae bacterium]MDH4297846.1 hypothetical protein [Cyclobacteriaceae bacterium]MDH5248798.1 hypothetical protein [Cyclobacteriaceae bacterium]
MILKIVIPCIAVFLSVQLFGQGSVERVAYKNIQKGKWAKAHGQLTKAMDKDSMNAAAAYVLAQYYFAPKNPDFQLDSAHYYVQRAIQDFQRVTLKQRERLNRGSIDSLTLVLFLQQVDSAAFFRARRINTEKAYIDYLTDYPSSMQRDQAIALRDEAAYLDALSENTYQALGDFMMRYPEAVRIADARNKYEALLFQARTMDGRLSSYEQYNKDYPNSPYQKDVAQAIFEIRTALGTEECYTTYLDLYTDSFFSKKARNILFYLIPEDQRNQFAGYLDNDSIRTAIALERGYIVPFLHNGKFGFMNQNGLEVIMADIAEIRPEYQCGNITDDVIVLPQKLVAPNGNLIYSGTVDSVVDIGYGFTLIEENSCMRVVHKTGFKVGRDCIEDAKVLDGKFLALRENALWSIWTFGGRMLIPFEWDDIIPYRDVIVLKKNNKFALATARAIAQVADDQDLVLLDFVDEVKAWENDFLWIRNNNCQGILNHSLDTLIKEEIQSLSASYFGATSSASTGVQTFNDKGEGSVTFQQIEAREPWTAARTDTTWRLYDPKVREFQSPGYDSIVFDGPFAIGQRKDSVFIYFSVSKILMVPQPVRTSFIPGQDSSSFLLLAQGDKKSIYTLDGRRLFTTTYDGIEYAGEGIFLAVRKEKKGLLTSDGKTLLPLAYDAIGSVNNGVVSLLKGLKFGSFDCNRKKLVKPQYAKNIISYNDKINVVYKDGMYGFAGWDNKAIGKSEFDEVRYWNDSAAFVRKKLEWMIYEIKTQKVLLDQVKEYQLILDGDDEKLAIVQQGHNYGVIHNRKGTIIPISFSDILNVGSRDEPLYFTEKHVEEASIFVVIYYDRNGKMIRKEVYEHDDYEKIYCSKN